MLFPFMQDETKTSVNDAVYCEYGIDFETGRLTGKIVTGKDALKVWIYKALITTRYIYDIYSWEYGHDLESLIGQGYDQGFINSEVERRIKDCLSINEKITGCKNFDINFTGDVLTASFTVDSIYGEVEMSV